MHSKISEKGIKGIKYYFGKEEREIAYKRCCKIKV